jgi:aminomethyltransferase
MTTPFFIDRSELGMLKLTGKTRIDLIHRMSTQDLRGMQSGEGRATVLTTEIGRIIDRLILYTSSDSAYALTGAHNADNIARYLMRFVFFNDDFHLEDVSAQTAIFGVYGAGATEKLGAWGVEEMPLHHWRQLEVDGITVYVHRTDPIAGEGYFIMGDVADNAQIVARLKAAGIAEGTREQFEFLRVKTGLPLFGHELTNDYIPLETGLWDDVSFSKGCYIGQEIIARMESRGKLAKQLLQFELDAPLTETVEIESNGKSVGNLTSVATHDGQTVALGYLKTRAIDHDLFANQIKLQRV